MTPIEKAIWFIETRLGEEMTLDDISLSAGVSRFYLSRAFTSALDISVIDQGARVA